MELTIRTSIVPRLFSARENGSGKNALIQTYLKPGYYLIQTGTTGNAEGRAGLICTPTPLSGGGRLDEEIIYRYTVPKDTALRFTLDIDQKGNYTIDHRGMNKSFFPAGGRGWLAGRRAGQRSILRRIGSCKILFLLSPGGFLKPNG